MKILTPEQKKSYDDNGYVSLDILTEEEKDELCREYDIIFKEKAQSNLEATWQGDWNEKKQKTVSVVHSHFILHCFQSHSMRWAYNTA